MTCNVGGIDRTLRLSVGVIALIIGFTIIESPGWRAAVLILGAATLVTGLVRFCPVSRLLGINTCRQRIEPPP